MGMGKSSFEFWGLKFGVHLENRASTIGSELVG